MTAADYGGGGSTNNVSSQGYNSRSTPNSYYPNNNVKNGEHLIGHGAAQEMGADH
jgi:hypothetical protein